MRYATSSRVGLAIRKLLAAKSSHPNKAREFTSPPLKAFAVSLVIAAGTATQAQAIVIRIDETVGGRNVTLPFVPNPGQVVLCEQLVFNFFGPNTCKDDKFSDKVVFSNVDNTALLFSDVDEGAPGEPGDVDTGLAPPFCPPGCLAEMAPFTLYLPFPGDPGGNPAFDRTTPATTIEYNIFSDPPDVPEPSTALLISSGLVPLWFWRLRRRGRIGYACSGRT
jgi:hypothetical protein